MIKLLLALIVLVSSQATLHASTLNALEISHDSNGYHLNIDMFIDAPASQVRSILTDYAHLDRLSDSIKKSEVLLSKDPRITRVQTQLKNCIGFFCSTLNKVEDLYVDNSGVIFAQMIPEQSDFHSGQSSWEVLDHGYGARILHKATLQPSVWTPPLLGPHLIKKAMRLEIIKFLTQLEVLSGAS